MPLLNLPGGTPPKSSRRIPIVFYGWNIFAINLELFKSIMQKSWSFFLALKNVQD
ncbi:unnamed protein product [Tenebrio molitor]|nr:unnamed protein product [Tenebrio molitor]